MQFQKVSAVHEASKWPYFFSIIWVNVRMKKYGRRNIACLTIAPTGTTSLMKMCIRDRLKAYPNKLRRVKYYDEELDREFVFITNNMELSAEETVSYTHLIIASIRKDPQLWSLLIQKMNN